MPALNTSVSISFDRVVRTLKIVLFLTILGYIAFKIEQMDGFFATQSAYFQSSIFKNQGVYFIVALLLLPFNLLFEAMKWKVATEKYAPISIWKSVKAVATGQALNLILPVNVGHMAGRLANFEQNTPTKTQGAGLVIVCQTAQMLVTFLAFLLSITFFGNEFVSSTFDWLPIISCSTILFLISYLLFNKFRTNKLLADFIKGVRSIPRKNAYLVFIFSVLRYITFSTQFILILYFLGANESWFYLSMTLSLVFMAKSMMPSFNFLSDLGVREFAALLFLPAIGLSENIVIAGSLWVWSINIFLPTLLGAFLLLKTKLSVLFC